MIDVSYILAGALTGFVVGLTGVGGGSLAFAEFTENGMT